MSGSLYAKEDWYDKFGDDGDTSDSDQSSSEDEIDIILHGTPEQRRKLQHLHRKWVNSRKTDQQNGESPSSSEDEFEKAMDAELTSHINTLESSKESSAHVSVPRAESTSTDPKAKHAHEEFYNDVYFDSDEDEEDGVSQDSSKKSRHKIISDDDLLYDPHMDDRDQKWVDKQRMSHRHSTGDKLSKKPNSDALLDCPACMTTLCIDCQRHEVHKHQYRAMFVMNCIVDTSETLECPEQPNKGRKKGKRKLNQTENDAASSKKGQDMFHPVRCVVCNTVVGVYDVDEVYHFFNVLASHT